jgi:hypothetical protein
MKSKIESLVEKIESADAHKLFTIKVEDDNINIEYSYDLHFAESVIGYSLESWNEDFPESFNCDGKIRIEFDEETGEITDFASNVEVYDCKDSKQNGGDCDGYQFDNNFMYGNENIIEYLESFLEAVEEIRDSSAPEIQEMEILFEGNTHPHQAINNTCLEVGKKADELYYRETDNWQPHNATDLIGRINWKKVDDFRDDQFSSIFEKYEQYFGEELTRINQEIS